MKILLCLFVIACGGSQQPAPLTGSATTTTEPPATTKTPFEQRRDTACKQIAPKLTACAVEDAKADLANGNVKQAQFDQDTSPQVLGKNTEKFIDDCTSTGNMSSRQVRVLEVCFKEESQCGPLRDCLKNLQPQPK